MISNVLTVGNQVIILFVLIAVGFLCNKVKLLNDITVKGMANFVLYVVSPCVIINSYQREYNAEMLNGLLISAAAALASHIINILIVHLIIHDKDKRKENVLRFGGVFSNCGYMSLPLQQALLGSEGVFYGATYVAIFNIVLWTCGVFLMDGGIKNISVKKVILNPGIIGTVVGLFFYMLSITLPSAIGDPVSYLAAMNTPIPMIIIGYHLANSKIEIKGLSTVISIVFRLIVSPAIMILGLYLCGIRGTIMVACAIATSAPYAAATTMFAEKFDSDTALSAACVSFTTILSVITMPLIVGFASML